MKLEPADRYSLHIQLFGTGSVRIHGNAMPPVKYRKEFWLIAFLALRYDREVSRDELTALFWPDNEDELANYYLRRSLSHLRTALGSEAHRLLSPSQRTLRLDFSDAFCDVIAFDKAAQSSSEEVLQQAIDLYQGTLLSGCQEEWIFPERHARTQAYLEILDKLAQGSLDTGDSASAARWFRLILAVDAYRESTACSLMQVLSESGDRAAMQQVYQELRLRLHNELNATPAPETEALYQRLHHREALPTHSLSVFPPSASPSRRHLPVPLTELVGREQEKEEVAGWLKRCRLVTLLGSGGVGKTRLAIAVADAVLPQFSDGVWFVDLAPLTEASLVPEATAKALGLSEQSGLSLLERLTQALTERSLLMVLDNCEHLISACAALVYQVLSACPGITVLATSRQALLVTGEQVYRVPSLSMPPEENRPFEGNPLLLEKDPQWLLEYDAVRLFSERAVQVSPSFRLTRSNIRDIVEICRHLDGIPLALEMAAARLQSLSPAEVNKRLSDRFRLLTKGNRAALLRQQTLRAALDWSYDLLDEGEKSLLHQLSVFAGGCTLEGVVAVNKQTDYDACLDTLSSLVEKSLVVYTEGESPRYRMLETVRQYGRERLEEAGELLNTQGRHRDFYLGMAETPHESDPTFWMDGLEQEFDNVRAALDFCQEDADSITMGLRFVATLQNFWAARNSLMEGIRRCRSLLSHPNALSPTLLRADALCATGRMTWQQSDYTGLATLFEEALAIYRASGDKNGTARALEALGSLLEGEGGKAYLAESLALYQETGNQNGIAQIHRRLGIFARMEGDFLRARQWQVKALELSRTTGNRLMLAHLLHDLSYLDFMEGDLAASMTLEEEALQQYREIGNRMGELISLQHLGWVNLWLDNLEKARTFVEASLHLQKEAWRKQELSTALECLAEIACREQDWVRAVSLWGIVETLQKKHGVIAAEGRKEPLEHSVMAAREALGDEAFARAWAKGNATTMEEAIAFVLEKVN